MDPRLTIMAALVQAQIRWQNHAAKSAAAYSHAKAQQQHAKRMAEFYSEPSTPKEDFWAQNFQKHVKDTEPK